MVSANLASITEVTFDYKAHDSLFFFLITWRRTPKKAMTRYRKLLQALPDLRRCYVPKGPKQVAFCARRISVFVWSNIYVNTRESSSNPNSNTLHPDSPQSDRLASCDIAQQYSSDTFLSFPFHCRNEKSGAYFKNFIIWISSTSLELR